MGRNISSQTVMVGGNLIFPGDYVDGHDITKRNGNVRDSFGGSANVTKQFSEPNHHFVIRNRAAAGGADLTFTVNGETFTVPAGEVFDEAFDPFSTVTVTTTVPFLAYCRG